MLADLNRYWARLQFADAARLRLYRKIAKMLANGLPLLRILEELHQRASDGGSRPGDAMAVVIDEWRWAVQNGRMLAEGMDWWVPRSEQMIIMAGEQSGRLDEALIAVIDVVQSSRRIRSAVLGGLAYPTAVVFLIVLYVYLFGTHVIPQFGRIVNPEKWTGAAKSLHIMSGFVQQWMFLVVLAIVTLVVTIIWSMPRWRGKLRELLDRIPPYSIYRLMVGNSFLMSFSALQGAGIPVEKCLTRMAQGADPWLKERLIGALLGVKSGLNCGDALKNAGYGFPAPEIVDDLSVYAEYKGFSEALKTLAEEWMEDGVEKVSSQMRVLNGIAIVTLAVVICWLVVGFFGIQQEIAVMTKTVH
ncbi:MAG TPA: type II secretion system F family protein [Noviherbaspirillum sp.]